MFFSFINSLYKSSNSCTVVSMLKMFFVLLYPASPILLDNSGLLYSLIMADEKPSVSLGGIRIPVFPSMTTSGIPPTFVAMTGFFRSHCLYKHHSKSLINGRKEENINAA